MQAPQALLLVALAAAALCGLTLPRQSEAFSVQISVDAGKRLGPLPEPWRFFGADEPNYATMPHGSKLLGELGQLRPHDTFFRAHNLLTSGDGKPALKWGSTNAYTQDARGNPVYDWTILDSIFDEYQRCNVIPYVEVGFMPEALSTHPVPYRHDWSHGGDLYTGWAHPPTDYQKWGDLAFEWAKHANDRYGDAAVSRWWWEVWNEPNIGYWKGTREEFLRLHDYAVDGIRRALPNARVGGADFAGSGGSFMREFLDHCLHGTNYATGRVGTPLDFVSFHAKGAPTTHDGHVRMGPGAQLRSIDEGFSIIGSYPELKGIPIVIGESDPDGCAACTGANLGYRNDALYASYTAAVYARELELAARHGVNLQGSLTWAFTFEGQKPFAGFRQLASNGVDLPILNLFRMLSHMGGDRVQAKSSQQLPTDQVIRQGVHDRPDVGVLASRQGNRLCVLVWHYFDDDVDGPEARVHVDLSHFGSSRTRLMEYRIDRDHSNAFTVWQSVGSPESPTQQQYRQLQRAGELQAIGPMREIDTGAGVDLELPRNGVSLLVLER